MGILLASEIAQRITQMPFREFLRREVFLPLGMRETSLGLGGRRIEDTAQCQVENKEDWSWNTPYWRDLGAPWGGVHSTAADISKFLNSFLRPNGLVLEARDRRGDDRESHARAERTVGTRVDARSRRISARPCSPRTFGHYGATGTVAWADPETGVRCVLLTTKPAEQSKATLLGPVSDVVGSASAES